MNNPKILVVEDDSTVRNLITTTLKSNNYAYITAANGEAAIAAATTQQPDIVFLDLGLPDLDGVEIIKRIRSWSQMPIIVISARSEDGDKVAALDAGADDYLPKPFSTSELLARVRAMLRRKDNFTPDMLNFGALSLNRSTYELICDGKTQSLSGKEFQVIEMLMQKPNAIISTEQFITHIWGWDASVETSVIWAHISNIRKKLEAIHAPIRIRYVRGSGYVLEANI